ncbi:N-acetylated alpha-linked acidic dipeptidase-like 1 [Cricetulus griseus]
MIVEDMVSKGIGLPTYAGSLEKKLHGMRVASKHLYTRMVLSGAHLKNLSSLVPVDRELDLLIAAITTDPSVFEELMYSPGERDTETLEQQFLSQEDWGPRRTSEEIQNLQKECQRLQEALKDNKRDNLALEEKLESLATSLYENLEKTLLTPKNYRVTQKTAEVSQEEAGVTQEEAEDTQEKAEDTQEKAEDTQEKAEDTKEKAEDTQEKAEDTKEKAEDIQEEAEDTQEKAEDIQEEAEDTQEEALALGQLKRVSAQHYSLEPPTPQPAATLSPEDTGHPIYEEAQPGLLGCFLRMHWAKILGVGIGAAALFGLGIILGHFAIPKATDTSDSQDLDLAILDSIMGQLDASRIRENLRELSKEPHVASSARDEALVRLLLERWQDTETGLDLAKTSEYKVLLSFPSQEHPNIVEIVGPNGMVFHSFQPREKNLTGEQVGLNVLQPYAAYAPPGTPKAINAAKHGVVGVLVYTDPADINDGKSLPSETFPNSWGLPPSGVERGSYYEYFGDPLTPYLPAHPSSFRLDLNNISGFPPIPAQPIGFEDAKDLLCEVKMSVHNSLELRNSSNVLGIIKGAVEPDRYVIYGNHRDSWVHGAVDPSSGTAVLLEISRVLGTLLKKGTWRPRRSIIFASWGAEEFGLIGSTEFTEEFLSKLQERTVAYINVDISVFANATLRAQGTPPVQSVIFSATKEISAPGPSGLSIYDNWIRYTNRSSPMYGLVPSMGTLGAGSDYASFIHFLGISSMDLAYTYDRSKTSARIYPTYHTAFDTFDYMEKFLDPGFSSHQAVARTAGSVLLRLSDSLFLPLKVSDYSDTLRSFLQAAQEDLSTVLQQHGINLGPLVTAVEKFETAAAALDQRISTLQKNSPNPLQVRMVNDQLMLLERAFLNPRAFPEERYYSHVLWAPNTASVATFPGLANAYARAQNANSGSEAWAEVQRQLSIVVTALEGAAATLEPAHDL